MTEWNIQSRAHACEACAKPFIDKERYHTLLFDERSAFRRSDICQACWQQQHSEGSRERKGFVSYWVGTYEAPPPPTEAIRKDTAESLLRKIIELNDPKFGPAAYILAAMLERKRILKVKEQLLREGQRLFIYEHGKSGDVFTIVDPSLQLTQLEAVQRDVAELLENGFPVPGAPTESASTGAPAETAAETGPGQLEARPDSPAPERAS